MDPSSQQSRFVCKNCSKSFASTFSLKFHSKNCKKCLICKKVFSGTSYKTGARNFKTHEDLCIIRAFNIPPAMGLALNNPPAGGGESRYPTILGCSGKHVDAVMEQTSNMDPLGCQKANNELNMAPNSQVELQSSAIISSVGFTSIQSLGCSGSNVEQNTPVGILAHSNSSSPQFHKQHHLQQPESQTKKHALPIKNHEMARNMLLSEQTTPKERLSTLFNILYNDSIPDMQLRPAKRQKAKLSKPQSPRLKDMVGSSSHFNIFHQAIAPSEIILPVAPSHHNEDIYAIGMHPVRSSDGTGNHQEETLENMDMFPIFHVDFESSICIPLPMSQQPGSGVQAMVASASQSDVLPQGPMPAERMLPVGLQVPSPGEHEHEDTFGGGNEVPTFQASLSNGNNVEETLENMGMAPINQVNFDSSLGMPLPLIQQPREGVHDTEASLSLFGFILQDQAPSGGVLRANSACEDITDDRLARGDGVPQMPATSGNRSHLEETLQDVGKPEVNQVDLNSPHIMQLSHIHRPGCSGVLDEMEASSPLPAGISPLDRMIPTSYQHALENICAREEFAATQAFGGSGNSMEETLEEVNLQKGNELQDVSSSHHFPRVDVVHWNSSEVPDIPELKEILSCGHGNKGKEDNNNNTISSRDEWLWSDSLWNWS